MIFYNNLLAKWFLGKKKHYFMVGGLFFTRYKKIWNYGYMQGNIGNVSF